ncbi:hypothetical protein AUJ95_02855 [Candidatus Desantisbacteria bacterium CG2_30_40_21]|uniref:Uncharacterized protein n=4 Tax=unclassified Candidatus Desantisiibacteriota TaxID=3106372 RepID=A0A2M7P2V7_9BACT|nr:MAG: hypothetical protein AUJ95_02855 [Candidatus Desantisbacteria bacterium CG2_30_40_21]PIP42535.1 MAG: hypothetical protein COX18_00075 [Candidatus Desantisbacteria bacterium CG23_combo_of_CG06-09_8_20_14_all_40_23]PIY19866.1 MAG: hypothetical protein COZ13_03085 [Candidatus Desantisbacteria bacterium CG_4_10_14_3_um_filter_40_18]PJB28651.1 MAG: hypothetical protein CO110_08980 [Candidatus Desantisbacteria bacterium CG_4_9_14_3_um_filter_40_11]
MIISNYSPQKHSRQERKKKNPQRTQIAQINKEKRKKIIVKTRKKMSTLSFYFFAFFMVS